MVNLKGLTNIEFDLERYSVEKNKVYKIYREKKELTQVEEQRLIRAIKDQYMQTNQVMATLREYKGITYDIVSDFESKIKRSKIELLRIVEFLKKAHETIIDLLYALEEINRDELHYIEQQQLNKAFSSAIEYKKYLKAITELGQLIGHDHEQGIGHHVGWYSDVLKNMHRYLNVLHKEYQKHGHGQKKNEQYKKLLSEFAEYYLSKNNQIMSEEAKLAIAEKMYEEILYLIELSKCLTMITHECTKSKSALDDVRYSGFRGFLQEL
ncbi:MAG: hypothetical protein ACMXX9_04685 [Candidatus Woesearchaeota archaeon]